MGLALLVAACGRDVPAYDGLAFARDPPVVGPLNGRFVISNNGDDSLSVVDPEAAENAPSRVQRIPIGFSPVELEGPHHVSAGPWGRAVYVNLSLAVKGAGSGPHGSHGTGTLPGFVLKLDATDGHETGHVQVDPNPGDNALSPDGKTLYVTHYDLVAWAHAAHGDNLRAGDSFLVVIDTDSMSVRARVALCPAAHGVRLSADGATLFATCGPDEIAVVKVTEPGLPVRRVSLPGTQEGVNCQRCPYALGVAPDGTVWVFSLGPSGGTAGRGGFDVFDPTATDGGAFDPARAVSLQGSPVFAAFWGTAAQYRAYVPEQGNVGDFVRVYESDGPGKATRQVGLLILARQHCQNAHMLLVDKEGSRGNLICEGDHRAPGTFVVLDLVGQMVVAASPVGVFPDGIAWVPPAGVAP